VKTPDILKVLWVLWTQRAPTYTLISTYVPKFYGSQIFKFKF